MSNGKRRKLCTNSRKHAYVYCSKAENFDVLLNAPYFHFRFRKVLMLILLCIKLDQSMLSLRTCESRKWLKDFHAIDNLDSFKICIFYYEKQGGREEIFAPSALYPMP